MPDPIKRASLKTLLCIVQSGGNWLTKDGEVPVFRNPNSAGVLYWCSCDQAEAEIERRFKRLQSRIRKLLRERNDL
jgi:hypothetical protein